MWLLLAVISTLFIGVSTILSKIGIKDADAYVTGAVTNTVLLAAFAGTALFSGSFGQVSDMTMSTWLSVLASGIVLSISWAFYFLGLKGGSVSVFLAIQSLTIVISMILCAVFIKEKITIFMLLGTALIITGTLLMMDRQELAALSGKGLWKSEQRWILFAGLSAVCASISYVIVKSDTEPIDTNVTSTFRYIIVVVMLWLLLAKKGKGREFGEISPKTWLFILLGAAASGAGHVLVYKALFLGKAAVIMTIYRMGMVISIILSRIFLKEKLSAKGWGGFGLLVCGVVLFAIGR
ncbi:MAG: EamA family transporter [Emergencia sp.]|jgi:transporter family protein|uniref:EamA family transporter n=1 Tax=Emergencia sp. JLR.KK010 TaxID=3114296 RepID=UPI00216CFD35|nr:EamA family transporter [Emergencia sp.]